MNAKEILRGFFIGAFLSSPCAAQAVDGGLAHYALAAKRQNAKPALPWITRLSVTERRFGDIRLADGAKLMERPDIVQSRYDQSVRHDLSRFYQFDRMRVNALMHYAGRRAGEVFSLGLDTGFSAEKITVKPALFVGYARAFQVAEQTHVAASMGGWLGGGVSEKPCRDTFDREYYCPTLTAWTDYRPPRHRLYRYIHLVFTHTF